MPKPSLFLRNARMSLSLLKRRIRLWSQKFMLRVEVCKDHLYICAHQGFQQTTSPLYSVPYSALAKTFEALEDTTKRYVSTQAASIGICLGFQFPSVYYSLCIAAPLSQTGNGQHNGHADSRCKTRCATSSARYRRCHPRTWSMPSICV